VKWLAFDFDASPAQSLTQAVRLQTFLTQNNIPSFLEFSGRKGYHVWIFLSAPIESTRAVAWLNTIKRSLNFPIRVETFPKQAWKKDEKARKGNVLKVPFGLHPVTGQRCLFGNVDGQGNFITTDKITFVYCDPAKLQIATQTSIVEVLSDILAPHWIAGVRHDLALALSGYLMKVGWTSVQVSELIEAIAKKADDPELANRLGCVKDTEARLEKGEEVLGYSALLNLLPLSKLTQLAVLASDVVPADNMRLVDRIRMDRSIPPFQKQRKVSELVETILNEMGKIIVDELTHKVYWLDGNGRLMPMESDDFAFVLLDRFGLGPDDFGNKVFRELLIRAHNNGERKPVYLLSHYDKEKGILYVNPVGDKVFALDGETISDTLNGKEVFFRPRFYDSSIDWNNWEPLDIWEHLTRDLSFQSSAYAKAKPEEQEHLLRAWIFSVFFPELMRVKPLLAVTGQPGSGKTTAVRRILKVLEDPKADVLELVPDKEDALRASAELHKLLVLDNLEGVDKKWMANFLDTLATGSHIELRKLYHTNETYKVFPQCYVALTAVSFDYMNDAFFDRILPLDLQRIKFPKPESDIQTDIEENWQRLWCDLLIKLNRVVKLIKQNAQPEYVPVRLADFARFVGYFQNAPKSLLDYDAAVSGLKRMQKRQTEKLFDSSPLVPILSEWALRNPDEASKPHSASELYTALKGFARLKNHPWVFKTPLAMINHLGSLQEELEEVLGMQVSEGVTSVGITTTFSFHVGKDGNHA